MFRYRNESGDVRQTGAEAVHICGDGRPSFDPHNGGAGGRERPIRPEAWSQPVRRIRISAEFNGIAWSRWGSAPCNQRIASGAAGIKARFRRPIPRSWRAWRPRPPAAAFLPSFTGRLGLPELPEPSKGSIAADGGAWQGNQSSRLEPMEGVIFFKDRFARCARNQRNRLRDDAPALIDALVTTAWTSSEWAGNGAGRDVGVMGRGRDGRCPKLAKGHVTVESHCLRF
jgi:hypothetical protein